MQTETTTFPALATALIWANGNFAAVMSSRDGKRTLSELVSLREEGLPSPPAGQVPANIRLKTDLQKWGEFDPAEYLRGLKFEGGESTSFLHKLFSFTNKGHNFVVPALALIRAFILPQRCFFEEAFQHSFLERTIQLNVSNEDEVEIAVTGKNYWPNAATAPAYINSLYSWFASHPSAARMVNSIHRNARAGWIGMDLPKVNAEVILTGYQVGNLTYVHRVRVCRLTPLESADFSLKGQGADVEITNVTRERRTRQGRASQHYQIPTSKAGVVDVTSEEWEQVRRVTGPNDFFDKRAKHDRRTIVNAILNKLHTGKLWSELELPVTDWRSVSVMFHRWHRSGEFSSFVSALQSIRNT